ncbi:MAG: L,D-transpeptidase family protein [Novosphingobium sp.]|nr:L,D-transpeptidase family protein [Novosphingobium sp.]MCP5401468.1 L,D-transpeptidase family protein [Novosphingobium sp.]
MRSLVNGRKLLAGAFLGLVGLAGAMALSEPPQRPELSDSSVAASQAKAQLAKAEPAAAPVAEPSPEASPAPASDDPFVIKRILPIEGPIRYGEWHWDDANVPEGPIVVTVDLEARVISIFRGGYEIGAAAVLLGTEEKPTPTGVFPITQKRRHHVSNLYDAEMPYMQRLTNDGITLHATEVEWGYASHGCIGMPEPFAAKVFATTKVGDKVYITRGKMVGIGDSLADS